MQEWKLERDAERVLRSILGGSLDLRMESLGHPLLDAGCDLVIEAISGKATYRFVVGVKSRVTPQTALSVCEQLRGLPSGTVPVVFAPTVSPRVAQILREHGIGYADRAGNCWLRSQQGHLLIERQGFRAERRPTPAAADPFSRKSSRIVRLLLSRPEKGWQVRKLAEHPDVQVSPGLVVKVKRALLDENYAVERQKLMYLRDPVGLLDAWSQKYRGPAEKIPLYFRGDVAAAEQSISRWCDDNALKYTLAGFSAAWRIAPEVRYSVGAAYLEDGAFEKSLLKQLAARYGGQPVDTGPNMYLWRAIDRSVFVGSVNLNQLEQPATSPLQTYLDLKLAGGRGEDAANVIFEKTLSRDYQTVIEREKEWQRDEV